jgi:DNA-binding transcriptional LysR family regulator
MAITFRQLEIFVAAAQDCNFRRTAERFAIAQPSVSNHIRSLENHLGQDLFARRRGISPVLTFEGMRFLEKARELVTSRAGMARRDDSARGASAVQLTIMAGPLLLDTCIRPRLTDFCTSYPGLSLQFISLHPTRSAAQLLDSGDIDLAVFTGEPANDPHLQSETVESVGCSIYAAPALASRATQPGTTLDELPWVMPPDDFAPTGFMWRYLNNVDVRPRNVIARSQFPDVVAHMALEGRGVTVLFDDFAATMLAEGRIVRIGPSLPRTSRILMIGQRARSAACKPVVSLLRQALRTPLGPLPSRADRARALGL